MSLNETSRKMEHIYFLFCLETAEMHRGVLFGAAEDRLRIKRNFTDFE